MGEHETGILTELTGAAARFFAGRLTDSWAPGYLASRGFGPEICRRWSIGYAPDSWTALTVHLRRLGFPESAIKAAGLAKRSSHGTLTDFFRDRIMFPVRSGDGAVAGFIGRAPPAAAHPGPVYLNTPTTSLYHKGSLLFGLYEAQPALAAGARAAIAEGPLDAVAIALASHATAASRARYAGLALCGTALTPGHVRLLAGQRGAMSVVVAFDADRAGRAAAVRAHDLLREVTRELTTARFPAGLDPAGYYREHGPAALAALLDSSVPLADLVIDACVARFGRWLEFTDGTFGALHAAAPLIAGLPAGQVARQVARVAARLGLTYAEVTDAVAGALPALLAARPEPRRPRP